MITKAPHFTLFSEATDQVPPASEPTQNSSGPCNAGARPSEETPTGWHFILRGSDGETQLDIRDEERGASAERLELMAVVRGLEALDQPSQVTLVTSSGWIRRGLQFGLDQWRQNRWQWERFGRMAPVKNADLWQRIDRALSFHDVQCRIIRFDPPVDDLRRPASKTLTRTVETRRNEETEPAPSTAGLVREQASRKLERRSSPSQTEKTNRIARRFFSWCGLCRSEPSLVIAAH